MAHLIPRVPANENDVFFPMRDSANLLETIVRQSGEINPVTEIPGAPSDELSRKVNELTRCLNTLVRVISGK